MMEFTPTATCKWCAEEIMLHDGTWVDGSIVAAADMHVDAFAALCGEGSECHEPETN